MNGFSSFFLLFLLALSTFVADACHGEAMKPPPTEESRTLNVYPGLLLTQNVAVSPPDNQSRPASWEVDFILLRDAPGVIFPGSHVPFVQRGKRRNESFLFLAEMGNIEIAGLPVTFKRRSCNGARFAIDTRAANNTLSLGVFTVTNGHLPVTFRDKSEASPDTVIVGTSAALKLFSDKMHIQTSLMEITSNPGLHGKQNPLRVNEGNVAEITARVDPFSGRFIADTEFVFSSLPTAAGPVSAQDAGYALKLTGKSGQYSYAAAFRRSVPEYITSEHEIVKKYRDRYSFNSMADVSAHSLGFDFSHTLSSSYGGLLRTNLMHEGALLYKYSGITALPFNLEYRKILSTNSSGNDSILVKKTESDLFSGNISYISGILDCNIQGRFRQKNDQIARRRELTESFVSFTPKLELMNFALSPSVSVQNTNFILSGQQIDTYAFIFAAKGKVPQKNIGYELNGGFKRSLHIPSKALTNGVSSKIKISAPFLVSNSLFRFSTIEVKGEYNNFNSFSGSKKDFSLLFSIDNG